MSFTFVACLYGQRTLYYLFGNVPHAFLPTVELTGSMKAGEAELGEGLARAVAREAAVLAAVASRPGTAVGYSSERSPNSAR